MTSRIIRHVLYNYTFIFNFTCKSLFSDNLIKMIFSFVVVIKQVQFLDFLQYLLRI